MFDLRFAFDTPSTTEVAGLSSPSTFCECSILTVHVRVAAQSLVAITPRQESRKILLIDLGKEPVVLTQLIEPARALARSVCRAEGTSFALSRLVLGVLAVTGRSQRSRFSKDENIPILMLLTRRCE